MNSPVLGTETFYFTGTKEALPSRSMYASDITIIDLELIEVLSFHPGFMKWHRMA